MDFSALAKKVMSGIKDGLSSIKTAAGNTAAAIGSAISSAYQKAAPVKTAAIPAVLAVTATATRGIPAAFLTAFGEGGAAAAAPVAATASLIALPLSLAALGYSAYDLYQTVQQGKAIDAQIAASQAEVALTRKAIAAYDKTHQVYLESVAKMEAWKRGEVTWTPLEVAPAPVVITELVTPPKPKVTVVTAPAPGVKEVVTPAPGVTVIVEPSPAPDVNVTVEPSPAPNVQVNVPAIPQPLAVTGPLTGAQLMAAIPLMATSTATASHQQTQNCIPTTGAKLLQALLGALVPGMIAAGFMFSPALQSAVTSVAAKFVDAIYSPLTAQAPITPEKGPGIGAVLLSQAVMFGSGAHIMSIMAEASAPLKHLGVGYLAAFMADAAGFSRIAAAYQGMMISVGLSQPMKYWAQSRFRPEIPSESRLLGLVGEYAITREQFNKYMPYHGYTQEWIDRLYELADKPFSPMLFRFLANAGELPEDLLDRELKNASYNELSIPPLKKAFLRLAAGELQGQFASSVTGAYRKGLLTQGPFSGHLDNLGYSDRQKERAGYAAELDFAVALAEDMRATYLAQHKLGQLSDAELGFQLSTLGYRGEKVSADVLGARARFKPKPEPKVDPAIERVFRETQAKYVQAYLSLYRDDYLDDDGLYASLISVKVDPDVAHATVFMESAKALPKLAE